MGGINSFKLHFFKFVKGIVDLSTWMDVWFKVPEHYHTVIVLYNVMPTHQLILSGHSVSSDMVTPIHTYPGTTEGIEA